MMNPRVKSVGVVAVFAVVVILGTSTSTHTPISSRWNYNEHLFPIFRDQCGTCHNDGGIAPMSLVTYQDAFPWTQSIREEILGLRMPPWQAEDGFGRFRNGHALSAEQMDMILEWSSGGYPQGPRDQAPEPPIVNEEWALGEPNLVGEMGESFLFESGSSETVRFFVLPSPIIDDQIISAVDFQPGARAVIRSASIFFDTSGAARVLDASDPSPGFAETVTSDFPESPPAAVWVPGQVPVSLDNVGHVVSAGTDIVLRVHYKKTWITEGQEFSDQSRVGFYFSDNESDQIDSLLIESPTSTDGSELIFTHEVSASSTLLSLLPEVDIAASELQVTAVKPDGQRIPMLWLREPDSGWLTRFWLQDPVNAPSGTTLETRVVLEPGATYSPTTSILGKAPSSPVRFSLGYVDGQVNAN